MSAASAGAPALNHLAGESSPYLRQHAGNPVAWYPWGETAFARARTEQKPVFLSIGYSTCHWCHVMARESFESREIATLLNAHFIAIKVDREERPDVDRLYMTFVQATSGHGGWPLSVWLTPELEPFFGGTYFPPADRWGRPGFATLLVRLAEAWANDREALLRRGTTIVASLREMAAPEREPGASGALERSPLDRASALLCEHFDHEHGGFGGAPKFPRPVTLNLLFRLAATGAAGIREGAAAMAESTLAHMAAGGVRDHLGGGFHRYSVDAQWRVPHFEKMLYDQAQLAAAYLEGWQTTGRGDFAAVVRETLAYVQRDLTAPEGGFYSAEDADSARAERPEEHGEGAFYVWSRAEIEGVCGDDAALVCEHFGVRAEGNAPEGADPQGEFQGLNILHVAQESQIPGEAARLQGATAKLLAVRAQRPRPGRDDKILTAWNGLMLSAFARAAQGLGDEAHLRVAERAAAFLRRERYDAATRRLIRCGAGARAIPGFAEDHAFLIAGLIDLYEAGGAIGWLQWAVELQEEMDTRFWDGAAGGYFGSEPGDASILVRFKEGYDGAEPSPNSVAALNLLRLAALLDRADFRRRGEETIAAFRTIWSRSADALPQMLVALDFALGEVRQIVLAGAPTDPELRALARAIHGKLEPPRVILWADGGAGQAWLAERVPFLRDVAARDGRATAYVCRDFACRQPTSEPAELARQLE